MSFNRRRHRVLKQRKAQRDCLVELELQAEGLELFHPSISHRATVRPWIY